MTTRTVLLGSHSRSRGSNAHELAGRLAASHVTLTDKWVAPKGVHQRSNRDSPQVTVDIVRVQ